MSKALVTNAQASVAVSVPFSIDILAGTLAQSSIDMYKRDYQAYLNFAGTPEAALDAQTLARWRTMLASDTDMSPNTINRMLSAVKRLMHEAASQGYTTHETAQAFEQVKGVKVSALRERTRPNNRTRISPEEMERLTSTPGTDTLVGLRDTALLHTLASSGLRASELASLTQGQIIKEGRGYKLSVRGKNEEDYEDAHLSARAYCAIQAGLQARSCESEYIFTSFQGRARKDGTEREDCKPMSEEAVWQTVTKYAERAGLAHVKPHDLRRFMGTNVQKQTGDIRKTQKALRHK